MTDEVRKFIKKEQLISAVDVVIAGVSGGADSVCLLLVLAELQDQIPFQLKAVHVEHGIRGAESIADAEFTSRLCDRLQVPCRIYPVDVPGYAAEHKLGLEEAARILRYECYRKAAEEELQCDDGMCAETEAAEERSVRIALAHHAEDNAETILFQLVRGSGMDGMSGMLPRRKLEEKIDIIRPLLCRSRREIEEFLAARGQEFCMDSTNQDTDYSRNKIRHQILPELTALNHQAVAHINQSAGLFREVAEYLRQQTAILTKNACHRSDTGLCIEWKVLADVPSFLQREVIHEAIKMAAGSSKDITASHIEKTTELFQQQVGRQISLPYGLIAIRSYTGIELKRAGTEEKREESSFFLQISSQRMEELLDGKILVFDVPDGKIRFQILDFSGEMQEISKKRYTKWLDYDKMKYGLQIRGRRSGDYLTISEDGHRKRLKEYFINEKIPVSDREKALLLTQDAHVVWVIGHRISADFKVKKDTKRILEVQILGGKYHED